MTELKQTQSRVHVTSLQARARKGRQGAATRAQGHVRSWVGTLGVTCPWDRVLKRVRGLGLLAFSLQRPEGVHSGNPNK